MKTTFKTKTDQRWGNEKRREFEGKTGVKWDWYHTGTGMHFTPIVTRDTPVSVELAEKIRGVVTENGKGFVKIAELCHMELGDVLSAAKTLVQEGYAYPVVNRCGNFAGIYRR